MPTGARFSPEEGEILLVDAISRIPRTQDRRWRNSSSPEKIAAVVKAPQPQNVSKLRAFLGMVNYYRKFISHLYPVTAPQWPSTTKQALEVDKAVRQSFQQGQGSHFFNGSTRPLWPQATTDPGWRCLSIRYRCSYFAHSTRRNRKAYNICITLLIHKWAKLCSTWERGPIANLRCEEIPSLPLWLKIQLVTDQ